MTMNEHGWIEGVRNYHVVTWIRKFSIWNRYMYLRAYKRWMGGAEMTTWFLERFGQITTFDHEGRGRGSKFPKKTITCYMNAL